MALVQHEFFRQDVTLSPAFKMLLAAAVSWTGIGATIGNSILGGLGVTGAYATTAAGTLQATTWLGTAATAFGASLTTGVLEGALTGNFDIGKILEGAVFSAVSAGLVSGINLETLGINVGTAADTKLWSLGNGNLNLSALMEKGLDATLSAGLSSAVYGTDFATSLRAGVVSAFIDLASMDIQNSIGANFAAGTAGSWASHLALGCLKASATGADCSAGMVGAASEQLFVAGLKGPRPAEGTPEYDAWKAENSRNLALASAFTGYLFSGGKGQNVTAASDYAVSAFQNNYLTTAQWNELIESTKACGNDAKCLDDLLSRFKGLSEKQDLEFRQCVFQQDEACVARVLSELRKLDGEYPSLMELAFNQGLDLTSDPRIASLVGLDSDAFYVGAIISANPGNFDGAELAAFKEWSKTNCHVSEDCLKSYAAERRRIEEEGLNSIANLGLLALGGPRLVASALKLGSKGLQALETCHMTPGCWSRLSVTLAEAAAGDALGGTTLVPVIGAGGAIAVSKGGKILSLIDSSGQVYEPVTTIAGKVVARSVDQVIGHFDDAGRFITGNPRISGIAPDPSDVARLNLPDASTTKLVPGEAEAGAVLEQALGVKLERSTVPGVDFVIASGPNKGQTIDFAYSIDAADAKTVDGINQFFQKNFASPIQGGPAMIQNHLSKADIVPLDLRHLTPANQTTVIDYVHSLPPEQQAKILIME